MNNIDITIGERPIDVGVKNDPIVTMSKTDTISIMLGENPMDVGVRGDPSVNVNMDDRVVITTPLTRHISLLGLDYESSGHTGFASSKQIDLLNDKITVLSQNTVPKQLSLLPNVELKDKQQSFLYIDTKGGQQGKITVADLVGNRITTANRPPDNMLVGDYCFLAKTQ